MSPKPKEITHFTILTAPSQGYELSEEELHVSLEDFRNRFTDASGAPKYFPPLFPSSFNI